MILNLVNVMPPKTAPVQYNRHTIDVADGQHNCRSGSRVETELMLNLCGVSMFVCMLGL